MLQIWVEVNIPAAAALTRSVFWPFVADGAASVCDCCTLKWSLVTDEAINYVIAAQFYLLSHLSAALHGPSAS